VKIDVEPQGDDPFTMKGRLIALPGLRMMRGAGSDVRYDRTKAMVSEDGDSVGHMGFGIMFGGTALFRQDRREIALGTGEGFTISHGEPASIHHRQTNQLGLAVPVRALSPFVKDVEGQTGRKIPRDSEAMRLLMGYLQLLLKDKPDSPEVGRLAAIHVHDLIAMAIGATRDGAEIAMDRGVRAARLAAVKADVLANVASERLFAARVAVRHGISPRHLHRLFETDGTTFSEFVLNARLAHAHRVLTDPRFAHQKITEVALAAGFGDLSYFNRTFRRRYAATPSEVRAQADVILSSLPTGERSPRSGG
jgi:AraC-like DNA-binding protein